MSGRETDAGVRGRLGRDEVLVAAEELVDRAGWDGLTMSALASSLGVRAPSLYHHVHNKSELLDLVARNAFDQFTADTTAYEELTTVDEWIELTRSGSLELRAFYADHPGLAGLIQSKAAPDRDQGAGSRAALIRAQIEALVRIGLPEPDARHLFEVTARWSLAAVVSDPPEDLFAAGLDLFLDGVRARLLELLS